MCGLQFDARSQDITSNLHLTRHIYPKLIDFYFNLLYVIFFLKNCDISNETESHIKDFG